MTLPEWLTFPEEIIKSPPESRELRRLEFDIHFPRIMELVCGGHTINKAVAEVCESIDLGAFMRWLKADSARFEEYKDAKLIRSEVWAGQLIDDAAGINKDSSIADEVQRSALKVNTKMFLIKSENKDTYGNSVKVESARSISITVALAEAAKRVSLLNDSSNVVDAIDE